MIHTIQSEWIKVRTVTMNWVLGGVTVALPLLVSVLTALFTSDDPGHYDTRTLVEDLGRVVDLHRPHPRHHRHRRRHR